MPRKTTKNEGEIEQNAPHNVVKQDEPQAARKPRRPRSAQPRRKPEESVSPVVDQTPTEDQAVAIDVQPEPEPVTDSSASVEPPEPPQPKSVIALIKSKITRGRKKKEEPAKEATPEVADANAPKGRKVPTKAQTDIKPEVEKKPRGRGKAKEEVPEVKAEDDFVVKDDLLVLSWRPRQLVAPKQEATSIEAGSEALAPRKSKRRKRKDLQTVEITAADALKPEAPIAKKPQPKPKPKTPRKKPVEPEPFKQEVRKKPDPLIPARQMINIPSDAPHVVLKDGVPVITRNGVIYPPISFFGSASDEKRSNTILQEIKMASESGIHLHALLLELDVDPSQVSHSVSMAAYMLSKIVEVDPDAQVILRVVFIAPTGWQDRYPDAKWTMPSGKSAEPSVCDDKFWGVAKDCVANLVKSLRNLPQKDHIMGLHLERGEWFFADGSGYDNSSAAKAMFRRWAEVRYVGDEVTLRAAWFDGQAQFANLSIPEYQESTQSREKFVRSSRKERRWVDYHLFLSDATVARIADLAYAVKEASEGYMLVGVSYGYTFEWSHPASGHLSLGKLLRTPEIDFIAGPPSYRSREPGGSAPFPCPLDSFALNGKLYISEEDYKTSIGDGYDPDDFNPVIKTPQALESVHWRGAGAALAHGAGMSWMDLWGNGWLKTANIWSRGAAIKDLLTLRLAAPLAEPEIAVFIDERALAYLVDQNAFQLLVQNLREAVFRSGLSAGFYLLSDLAHRENFPESKLYIFLNAWDVRPELRSAIKSRLQRNGKVLFWLYAGGQFDSGRDSLERAREVTGIALKPQPYHSRTGTTLLNRRHPLCEAFAEQGIIGGSQLEPSYFGIPEDSTVLGEYSQSGLPSFLIKEFKYPDKPELNWTSVFLGEPVATPAFIRALGQLAGCHVWNYQEDIVHVRPPFLMVHCKGAGQRTIALPSKWSAYNAIAKEWSATDSPNLRFSTSDGSSHLFLVGPQSELEHILSVDKSELLKMENLPQKAENTTRFDVDAFDVPIVRLDEWMEGNVIEEVSEEWLLKPKYIEEIEEQATTPIRRKRRRGNRGGGTEETSSAHKEYTEEQEFDDLGMSVVFRKKD